VIERRAARHFDPLIVLLALALVTYGCVLLYSASLSAYPDVTLDHPMVKQLVYAAMGLVAMVGVAWLDYRAYGQFAPLLYVAAVGMLIAVLIVGDSAYGSTRMVSFAGQQIRHPRSRRSS
jgi:cell division protein FtsW (lipid II flippase)